MQHRLAAFAFATAFFASPVVAQEAAPGGADKTIGLELNKLEQTPAACRAYFVVTNGAGSTLGDLGLDVFVFDRGGAIARRVGLSFTDVRPDRRKVVLFDLEQVACDDVGELLVNDVMSCTADGGPLTGCADMIETASRAGATFSY